jgi:asparagine N-glycosylation enzyme membrane subunit Stt3
VSEQISEQKRTLLPLVITGVILAAICGISLYIRIALPYEQIFVNDWIWFRETDAYYYIRNIETLVQNSLHFNSFDPYILYPDGGIGLARPFFAWLTAAVTLLVSGGSAALHSIEAVGAYMPAILGTLTVIPVYFIGKELFNRWVGVIAAALTAILPSEFMHRSLLGFTDHHVAEVLLSTVSILFLIMAIKRAREREISFQHIVRRDWSAIRKPLIYTLLSGIFLGLYLLTWQGGLLFMFIIFAYLVIQFVVDHFRRKSSDYLCIIGVPLFLIGFLMLLPVLGTSSQDTIYRISLGIAIATPVVLSIISRVIASRAWKPVYYLLTLLGLAGIVLAMLYAIDSSLFRYMVNLFSIFGRTGAALTIMEVSPILFPFGEFTFVVAWSNFTTAFFIAGVAWFMLVYPAAMERMADKILFAVWIIITLITVLSQWLFGWFIFSAMLVYFAIKHEDAGKILFLVWSIVMLLAVLGQRRFGYYYTVNAALLTGYFSWKMLDIAGLGRLLTKSREVVGAVKKFKKAKKAREKAKHKTFMQPRGVWVRVLVVAIVLFFVVVFPNIPAAEALAGTENIIMNKGWYTSCLWLQDKDGTGHPNTPEPFGDPEFYYELYPPRREFDYPDTAYGVMSWWDYGYFIMQIGHRIPNANPTQANAAKAGEFFTAQNESEAQEIVQRHNLDTKYVMMDNLMASSKFYAMVEWAGGNVSTFQQYYGIPPQATGGVPQALYLFFNPAYYRSIAARLYNFNGQAALPAQNSTLVVPWNGESVYSTGRSEIRYRNIAAEPRYFSSYEDAQAYVAAQTSGNYGIVGYDPSATIVPLEALDSYELVYQSDTAQPVKVFKYLGPDES